MIHVVLRAPTASFRVPYIMSVQPTLRVPPPSTVLGLIRNAAGRWVDRSELGFLAYRLEYVNSAWDLESIQKHSHDRYALRDIVRREFLVDVTLHLYLDDEWEYVFRRPRGVLVLGRSSDLASVEDVLQVQLERGECVASGVFAPTDSGLYGVIYAVPLDFTRDRPRRPVSVLQLVEVLQSQPTVGYHHDGMWLHDFSRYWRDDVVGRRLCISTKETDDSANA